MMLCLGGRRVASTVIPTLKSVPIMTHTQMIQMPSTSILQDMPIILTVRAFGIKRKKRKSQEELAREQKELLEKLERERYELLRGDPSKPPPFIDVLVEKGPDSWDSTGLFTQCIKRQFNTTTKKILAKNAHNFEYLNHLQAEINDKIDEEKSQLRFERWLTALQYQSRLDIAEAYKKFGCETFHGFTGISFGMSNYPTVLPRVDTLVYMPQSSRSIHRVKKGQLVKFILLRKPMLKESPKDIRFANMVIKRIAGLEGDIVDFKGRKYTIPKGYFWALGDNPPKSGDSREWGAVPLQNIRSRVLFAYKTWYNPFTYKTVTKVDEVTEQ